MKKLLLLLPLAACQPDLGDPPSLVTSTRVLAIASEPAEAKPGDDVAFHMLVASPSGTGMPDVGWAWCAQPKPVSENDVVDPQCVYQGASMDTRGIDITATLPDDGCTMFGPEAPPSTDGQPPARPRDPDVTGGFYQPVRAVFKDSDDVYLAAVGLARIRCNLADAPVDIVQAYNAMYTANTNPVLERVVAQAPGDDVAHDLPHDLPAGTDVVLRAHWSDVESFPVFDRVSRTLVTQRESIRVSWFVSGGTVESDRTGRGADEMETFADDVWTTPDTPGPAHLWVVVRDSRGGVAFAGYDVTIE